jgi:hypothetical protein
VAGRVRCTHSVEGKSAAKASVGEGKYNAHKSYTPES